MSTSLKPLLCWAIVLLALVAVAKSDDEHGSFWRALPFAKPLSRKVFSSYCHSQLRFASQNLSACLDICGKEIYQGLSLQQRQRWAVRIWWFTFGVATPCVVRCWHRYRLVLPLRGDLYDQLVASAQCNATSDQRLQCSKTSFKSARTADLSALLTPRQRYEKVVCEFSCGQKFTEEAAMNDCKANCDLKQMLDVGAFKTLSECLAHDCAGKAGEELHECKLDCHEKC